MPHFGKSTRLVRLVCGCVIVNMLLVACSSGDNLATPTSQNAPLETGNHPTQKQPSVKPQTTPLTQTTTSPFYTKPVYSGLTKGKLKEMFPVLVGLTDAKSFRVNDDWNGLSTDAPRQAHFSLARNANQFEGEGVYSIGGYSWVEDDYNPYYEASVTIIIPLDVGQKFLQMLANAPVEEGPSKSPAATTNVDRYPSLYMNIDTGFGSLEFNSLDESNSYYIRAFTFAGRKFNGTDNTAFDAFELLKPYLHSEVQKTLYKPSISEKSSTTPATTPDLELTPTVR
jgi:hypothetical protein